MLLSLLIFLLYTILFVFILYRCSLQKTFVLSFKQASLAFIVKLAAGCLYGYFFLHFYGGDDTWFYHNESLKEYALLKTDPLHFLVNDIFTNGYQTNQLYTVFDSSASFTKNLEYTLLIKMLAVFDVFSGGRYYVNVIFYNMIVFWGCYCLFKMLATKYRYKRLLWLIFIFYFPPLLFWTSGIRKDGLCFAMVCGLIYQLYFLLERSKSIKRILFAVLLFCMLFLMRNYLAISFIPVFICYAVAIKFPKHALLIFFIVSFFCAVIFFVTALSARFNLPQKMAERQHAFLQLPGNSYVQTDSLSGSFKSYVKNLPQAVNHVFFRPYFFEATGMLYLFSFIENLFFYFLLIFTFIKISPAWKRIINDPLLLSFIMLALINYIIIGYTVPFIGAIVRYKANFEIFFILVLLQLQKTNLLHAASKKIQLRKR